MEEWWGGGWRGGEGGGVEKDLARLKGKGGRFQAVLKPKVLCLLWGHNRFPSLEKGAHRKSYLFTGGREGATL